MGSRPVRRPLTLIAEPQPLTELLGAWGDRFEAALTDAMLWRLGVAPASDEADRALVAALVAALQTREATIDRVFFDWRGGRDPGAEILSVRAVSSARPNATRPANAPSRIHTGPTARPARCTSMRSRRSGRRSRKRDDWQPLDDKVTAVRRMGEAMMADAPTA